LLAALALAGLFAEMHLLVGAVEEGGDRFVVIAGGGDVEVNG
jgi:hypothetical protein